MDISINKQTKFHTKRLGYGYGKGILKEKLNLF